MTLKVHSPVLRSLAAGLLMSGVSVGFAGAQDKPATRPATGAATRPATAPSALPATKPTTAEAGIPKPPVAGQSSLKPIAEIPETLEDLKALEARVAEITKKVLPAVVGVQAGAGQGSGVIVGTDGYVLTAGHVSGDPGRDVSLILADGRRIRAKTLGANSKIDSGLIKITDKGDFPHVSIGKSANLKKGQWVLALGHPGGYRRDRPPVLRLGRVLAVNGSENFVMTDCTLVGGDSGGPLFDLDGNVVAIHSRIGPSTLNNMHTPSDTYVETWDRLAKGEAWGSTFAFLTPRGPMLGIGGENVPDAGGALIGSVTPGGPADKAGVRPGDLVTSFDGKPVKSLEELAQAISRKSVGDRVKIEVLRNGKKTTLDATLARRPRE